MATANESLDLVEQKMKLYCVTNLLFQMKYTYTTENKLS